MSVFKKGANKLSEINNHFTLSATETGVYEDTNSSSQLSELPSEVFSVPIGSDQVVPGKTKTVID